MFFQMLEPKTWATSGSGHVTVAKSMIMLGTTCCKSLGMTWLQSESQQSRANPLGAMVGHTLELSELVPQDSSAGLCQSFNDVKRTRAVSQVAGFFSLDPPHATLYTLQHSTLIYTLWSTFYTWHFHALPLTLHFTPPQLFTSDALWRPLPSFIMFHFHAISCLRCRRWTFESSPVTNFLMRSWTWQWVLSRGWESIQKGHLLNDPKCPVMV